MQKLLINDIKRTGSLFEKKFERKIVNSDTYLQNLIHYIHYNPVKHRFTENIGIILGVLMKVLYLVNPQNLKENFLFVNLFKTKKPLKKSTKKKKLYRH